jgi:hypothetical protein
MGNVSWLSLSRICCSHCQIILFVMGSQHNIPMCIQSPAIRATLSKLHLNKNTSRSIVVGPSKYTGLSLPNLYTAEGIGQIHLLLGHLRLKDKTADLIVIDISYIQLSVSSSTLFFNVPYNKYLSCVDFS